MHILSVSANTAGVRFVRSACASVDDAFADGTYATAAEVEAVLETSDSKRIDKVTLFSALLSANSPKVGSEEAIVIVQAYARILAQAAAKRTALVPRSSFSSVPGVVRRTAFTTNLLEAASKTSTASSAVNVSACGQYLSSTLLMRAFSRSARQ